MRQTPSDLIPLSLTPVEAIEATQYQSVTTANTDTRIDIDKGNPSEETNVLLIQSVVESRRAQKDPRVGVRRWMTARVPVQPCTLPHSPMPAHARRMWEGSALGHGVVQRSYSTGRGAAHVQRRCA